MDNNKDQTNPLAQMQPSTPQMVTVSPSTQQTTQPVLPVDKAEKGNNSFLLFVVVVITGVTILGTGAYWFIANPKKTQIPVTMTSQVQKESPTTTPSLTPTPSAIKTLTQVNSELNKALQDDIDSDFASVDKDLQEL